MIEVNDKPIEWDQGMTVMDLIKKLNKKDCAVIRLNNKLVSSPNFHKVLIPDNATIYIIPLVAGG